MKKLKEKLKTLKEELKTLKEEGLILHVILLAVLLLSFAALGCTLFGIIIFFLIFGEKTYIDIHQAVLNNRVAVCHIDFKACPYVNNFESFDFDHGYIQYETEEHIILKYDMTSCHFSFTADSQPKAEYYYDKRFPMLYISIPCDNVKTHYDIPITALNAEYDHKFRIDIKSGVNNIGKAEPYYMRYYPCAEMVDVWTYTGDSSNRLRLYKVIPVLRTDIETIECVNGEIWVPYHTDHVLTKICPRDDGQDPEENVSNPV